MVSLHLSHLLQVPKGAGMTHRHPGEVNLLDLRDLLRLGILMSIPLLHHPRGPLPLHLLTMILTSLPLPLRQTLLEEEGEVGVCEVATKLEVRLHSEEYQTLVEDLRQEDL